MNKQEAIGIIEQSKIKKANTERVIFKAGEIVGECVQVDYVPLEVVVNTINQIHEPQKVVVPKFIDDLIEELKIGEYTVGEIGAYVYDGEKQKWIDDNEELFYRAFLDGYEVKQEKLHTVEIPDPHSCYNYRFLSKNSRGVFLGASCDQGWERLPENQLTEAEIKQDFEWAWDAGFAKEVE